MAAEKAPSAFFRLNSAFLWFNSAFLRFNFAFLRFNSAFLRFKKAPQPSPSSTSPARERCPTSESASFSWFGLRGGLHHREAAERPACLGGRPALPPPTTAASPCSNPASGLLQPYLWEELSSNPTSGKSSSPPTTTLPLAQRAAGESRAGQRQPWMRRSGLAELASSGFPDRLPTWRGREAGGGADRKRWGH